MKHRLCPRRSVAFDAPLSQIASACLTAIFMSANAWAQALPVSTAAGQFMPVSGNASLVSGLPNGQTVIRLENNKSVLEWARLSVAQGNSLQFIQPNQQSVVLNRVTGQEVTRIDGSLLSNGHVWLLNPSGVLFGVNSTVNVQSLLATTRAISDADFLTNKLHFAGGGAGPVTNAGVITVGEGGYVVLSGQNVENLGTIQARLGQVHLASGKAFVMDFNGDKLLRFDVTQALSPSDASQAIAKNAGNIVADGGRVQITARAANGLVGQVVNTGGLLQANSVRSVNGEIILDAGPGGKSTVGGSLSAQGLDNGTKGGNITALGDTIQISSDARLNASGQAGGGNVLVGGDWQGSGGLQQAKVVDMQAGSDIKANALQDGDGGKVVLWSDLSATKGITSIEGSIQATGGQQGGKGGKIETSGRTLQVTNSANVSAASPKGAVGVWLLDPVDVEINASNSSAIQTALGNNHVLITTTGADPVWGIGGANFTNAHGAESGSGGNITINTGLSWTGNILSLQAHSNVYINSQLIIGTKPAVGMTPPSAGGLHVRVGYSTPGTDGGAYDASKKLEFGTNSSGFTGEVTLKDELGNLRSGGGFILNDVNYSVINSLSALTNMSGNYALAGGFSASGVSSPIAPTSAGAFTGRLNGLGNSITSLSINQPLSDYVGLIGYASGASISSVNIVNASIVGRHYVGALVGYSQQSAVANSMSSGSVSANSTAGGLVGANVGGSVSNSRSSASVSASDIHAYAGGLVGLSQTTAQSAARITDSSASGNVSGWYAAGGLVGQNEFISANANDAAIANSFATGSVTGADSVGGLAGLNVGGRISNSYATGAVDVTTLTTGANAGGLVGTNKGTGSTNGSGLIENSYANNSIVKGYQNIGGLVGLNQDSAINNSYATSPVSGGNNLGGLVGVNQSTYANTSVLASYATGNVSGTLYAGSNIGAFHGGLVGVNQSGGGKVSSISKAYATGNVTSFAGVVGGLVGQNLATSTINDSYATGNVTNNNGYTGNLAFTGGLVGDNAGSVSRVFASGNVSQTLRGGLPAADGAVGGLIGTNESTGSVSSGFSLGTVTNGQATIGASLAGSTSANVAFLDSSNGLKQASYSGFDYSSNWFQYENQTRPLLRTFLTPLTVTLSAPTITSQAYSGTTTYTGAVTPVYSITPNVNLLGTLTASLADKHVGNQLLVGGGLYSNQNGYLITYSSPSVSVTRAPLNVTANAVTKTYDGTTAATGAGTVGALAGAGAGEVVNAIGTQAFLDKNAGTNKTVRAAGVTIKDSVNADVTSNYNITYVDNTSSTINPAVLSVSLAGVNKAFDGNTNATVTTTDNRFGNDALSVLTTASFADPSAALNKPVTVSSIALSGVDAPNYSLAATSGSTTANITSSQTTTAVQVAVSAALPSTTAANAFASAVTVSAPVTSTATSTASRATTTASASTTTTTSTTTASTSSAPTSSASTPAASTGGSSGASSNTSADEPSNVIATNPSGSSTATGTATASAAPTTATISVTTQSVSPTVAAATAQATNTTQTVGTTGLATATSSAQVQIVSLSNTTARSTPAVGAQTIAPVQTPRSAEDQADPVLAAVSSFKPAVPASTANRGPARGRDAPVVVPLVQGVLVMETSPPKAATQAVDEQRLSASGDRSRW